MKKTADRSLDMHVYFGGKSYYVMSNSGIVTVNFSPIEHYPRALQNAVWQKIHELRTESAQENACEGVAFESQGSGEAVAG